MPRRKPALLSLFARYLLPSICLSMLIILVREDAVLPSPHSLGNIDSNPPFVNTPASRHSHQHRFEDDVTRNSEKVQKEVEKDILRYRRACYEKKWALEILHTSDGTAQVNEKVCDKLPTLSSVNALYGEGPVVYGMDTCEQFRKNVEQVRAETRDRSSSVPTVRVAGLFQSGTNAMAFSLARNLRQDYRLWRRRVRDRFKDRQKELFNVPWTKHIPPQFRYAWTTSQDEGIDLRLVLPVVLVRDPYWWMQSMCKFSYDASWKKRGENVCPNIVNSHGINGVKVSWERRFRTSHESVVTLWNDWIREYFDADFPRLIIRFEDQLFHAEKVMQLISECSGIGREEPYRYMLTRSKQHGKSNDFITAMSKYGSGRGRLTSIDPKDLEYSRRKLDPELMSVFGYQHVVNMTSTKRRLRTKFGNAWGDKES